MYIKTVDTGLTITDQLGSQRAELVRKNRHYIISIIEVLMICARQDISLRGHRESVESNNRGNFLEILSLLARHDPVVEQYLHNNPRNATYTSPDIQNTLLKVVGKIIRSFESSTSWLLFNIS